MNGIGTAPKLSHKADTSLTPDNVAYNTVIMNEPLSLIFGKPRFLSSSAVPYCVIWLRVQARAGLLVPFPPATLYSPRYHNSDSNLHSHRGEITLIPS
jgi:hypothetical protein